jgi:hypothetical protein
VNRGYLRDPDGAITVFDAPGAGTGANQGTLAYGITPAIPGVYFDGNNVMHGFVRSAGNDFTAIGRPERHGHQTTEHQSPRRH